MSTLTCVRTKHKPEQTYEEFKEARLQGFGASDMGSLLNEGDYSCKRRLFLERLGLMPEDDRLQHHVERGKFLESPVAGLYASRTGRNVREAGTAYIKEFPFMRANTDRLVWIDFTSGKEPLDPNKNGWGCLEIKCPGEHMFRKIKKEGLPLAYILQLQWQMFCYGTSWGTFAIYWADGHELLTFDVQRDDELIESMVEKVKFNWLALSSFQDFVQMYKGEPLPDLSSLFAQGGFPAALDSHSKACERCPMFEKCHNGVTLSSDAVSVPDLEEFALIYEEAKTNAKLAEKHEKEAKNRFEEKFLEMASNTLETTSFVIQKSQRKRESLSPKVKEVLTAEQLVSYTCVTEYDVITVKRKK